MIQRNRQSSESRASLAKDLCRVLHRNGIPYGILHGAENFPLSVGRDFDILISEGLIAVAVDLVRKQALATGWRPLLAPIFWAGAPLVLWKLENGSILTFEMHFIGRLEWGGTILAEPDENDTYSDPASSLRLTRCGAFSKRVLILILAGCWSQIGERIDAIQPTQADQPDACRHAEKLFGKKCASELMQCLEAKDLSGIRSLASRLRRRILLRAATPFLPVRFSAKWLIGKICRRIGWIQWRLPNLIISSPSNELTGRILTDVINELAFAKCMLLPAGRPVGILNRFRERYRIRLHTALFRYTALAMDQASPSLVARRIGRGGAKSGNLVFYLEKWQDGISISASLFLGSRQKSVKFHVTEDECPAIIASTYLSAAEATCDGIEHFGNNILYL